MRFSERRLRSATGFGAGLALLAASALAQLPGPPQFQVNTYTPSYQGIPTVAPVGGSGFVVAWESYGSPGTDSSDFSIQARRYSAGGLPLGGQFQVNSYTSMYQFQPAVAASDEGQIVVVWESYGSSGTDSDGTSIQGQRYGSDGEPLAGQFQVNTYTTGGQFSAATAMAADGRFVVVWQSFGSPGTDSSTSSIQGQRYSADGSVEGSQFQVNAETTSAQLRPDVSFGEDGSFVVVWESSAGAGTDDSFTSVQGQRFSSDGLPVGREFQVNSYTTNGQVRPDVEVSPSGEFVVVWESNGSSGTDVDFTSVQGQRYAADGSPLGGEFQVNTYTTADQGLPAVSIGNSGSFVVAWTSYGSYGNDDSVGSIQVQRYAETGVPIEAQFQVNTHTPSIQILPAIAFAPNSEFVIAWLSDGSPGSDTDFSIQARRLSLELFADGFESGDTSRWDATVP